MAINDLEKEILILKSQTHPGRKRTQARIVAGMSLKYFYNITETNYIKILQKAVNDETLPKEIRDCAIRLTSRVDANFNSLSVNPIDDALKINEFVKQ